MTRGPLPHRRSVPCLRSKRAGSSDSAAMVLTVPYCTILYCTVLCSSICNMQGTTLDPGAPRKYCVPCVKPNISRWTKTWTWIWNWTWTYYRCFSFLCFSLQTVTACASSPSPTHAKPDRPRSRWL